MIVRDSESAELARTSLRRLELASASETCATRNRVRFTVNLSRPGGVTPLPAVASGAVAATHDLESLR